MDDTATRRSEFVTLKGNPAPEGAAVVWFRGEAGRELRACAAPALSAARARGTVIVCPGRTEFIEKYFEVGRELQKMGFAVLILDWPGQGLSERLLDDSKKGHIDRFETFMGALANGLEELQERLPRPHVFTLGAGEVIDGLDVGCLGLREGGVRRVVASPPASYRDKAR